MGVTGLDHVNLRTPDAERLAQWYERVLGLKRGKRPDFAFPGHWLYAGDIAVVHLVEVKAPPAPVHPPRGEPPPKLEHFSLRAEGLDRFLARLEKEGVPYRLSRLPGEGFGEIQVNINDPDGNHLHVDFAASEDRTPS